MSINRSVKAPKRGSSWPRRPRGPGRRARRRTKPWFSVASATAPRWSPASGAGARVRRGRTGKRRPRARARAMQDQVDLDRQRATGRGRGAVAGGGVGDALRRPRELADGGQGERVRARTPGRTVGASGSPPARPGSCVRARVERSGRSPRRRAGHVSSSTIPPVRFSLGGRGGRRHGRRSAGLRPLTPAKPRRGPARRCARRWAGARAGAPGRGRPARRHRSGRRSRAPT
jgi:hypothetical protein